MLEKIDLSKKMDKDTYKQVIGEQSERLGLLPVSYTHLDVYKRQRQVQP